MKGLKKAVVISSENTGPTRALPIWTWYVAL
jgi:hypothetical protein